MAGEDTGSEEANGYRHARGPVDDQRANPRAPTRQRPTALGQQAETLAGIGFSGRGRIGGIVRHVAEATCSCQRATCTSSSNHGRRQVDRETDHRRVTCVKHLCNWMEIATPLGFRATDGGAYGPLSSSFSSVSSTPVLKAEQDVHLRAHGCVTTKRAQWHDRSHRRTDVPRSRRPVGLCQG